MLIFSFKYHSFVCQMVEDAVFSHNSHISSIFVVHFGRNKVSIPVRFVSERIVAIILPLTDRAVPNTATPEIEICSFPSGSRAIYSTPLRSGTMVRWKEPHIHHLNQEIQFNNCHSESNIW